MNTQDRLKELLLQIPSARLAAGGKEVVLRCPYCGDSRTDRRAAHFYVSLGDETTPSMFNCFRVSCLAHGITTAEKLLEWDVYDQDTAIELTKSNKHILSLDKNRKFKDSQIYKITNTFISDTKLSEVKLKYINSRLGLNLTYDDLLKNKIVLNLKDLLIANNITECTRDLKSIYDLNESFIGFISQDNAFVNMRNLRQGKVNKSIDMRYVNYSIFNKVDNTMKYYTLPAIIDLNNPERIRINIAEGAFDILSVYYNLHTDIDHHHSIYSAILGGGYFGICKHFILNMKLINIEFHIYIDNDVDNTMMQDINRYLKIYNIPLYVHRNVYPGEKDFGVKLSNIKEQIYLVR